MVLFNLKLRKVKNSFKNFYSDLAGNLVREYPVALSKLYNNSMKQYYINIKKNCPNFELCSATLETIKKILGCLDTSKDPGLGETFSNVLKDGAEVLPLPLWNLANLAIKQFLFPDCKIKVPF